MSRYLLHNFEEYSLNQDNIRKINQPYNPFCLCCLQKEGPMINLENCVHSDLLDLFGKTELKQFNQLVCLQCHSFMKKMKSFQDQVLESFHILLSGTYTDSTVNKHRIINLTKQDIEFMKLPPDIADMIPPYRNIVESFLSNITNNNFDQVEPILNLNIDNSFANVEIISNSHNIENDFDTVEPIASSSTHFHTDELISTNTNIDKSFDDEQMTQRNIDNRFDNDEMISTNTNIDQSFDKDEMISINTNIDKSFDDEQMTQRNIDNRFDNDEMISTNTNIDQSFDKDEMISINTNIDKSFDDEQMTQRNIDNRFDNDEMISTNTNTDQSFDTDEMVSKTTHAEKTFDIVEPNSSVVNFNEDIQMASNLNEPRINILSKTMRTALEIIERNNQSFINLGSQLQILNEGDLSFLESSLFSKEILTHKNCTDLDNSKINIEINGPEKTFYDGLTLSPKTMCDSSEIGNVDVEPRIVQNKPMTKLPVKQKIKRKVSSNQASQFIKTVRLSQDELNKERVRRAQSAPYLQFKHRCETCLLGFNYQENLEDHIKRKHGPQLTDNVVCDICSQIVVSLGAMTEHNYRHYTRYDCIQCGKRYQTCDEAMIHLHKVHTKKTANNKNLHLKRNLPVRRNQ